MTLRRVAFRALSPPTSLSTKPRSITTLTPLASRLKRQSLVTPFQKRFASEEVTQSEPEADGATEAQHGENSIAESSTPKSADHEHSSVASAVSSIRDSVSKKASSAADSITSSARSAQDTISGAAGAVSGFEGSSSSSPFSRREASEPSNNLYIGNLFFDVTEDMLGRELEKAGTVISAKIIMDGRGLSKGYVHQHRVNRWLLAKNVSHSFGYVEFATKEEAGRAIEMFNQQTFQGRRVSVQYTGARPGKRGITGDTAKGDPTKTLFIGNMAFEMSDQDLNDLFRTIENVIDVRVAIDRRTGQPRGFAHADFVDIKSAEKAMAVLKDKEVMGRRLRIDYSQTYGRSAPPRSST